MKGIGSALLWLMWACICNAQFDQGPFSRCFNPNNNPGVCVPLTECQSLLSIVYRQPLKPIDREFVRASQCFAGFDDSAHSVCCTTDVGYSRQSQTTSLDKTSPTYMSTSDNGDFDPYWNGNGPRVPRFFPYDEFGNAQFPQWSGFGNLNSAAPERRQVSPSIAPSITKTTTTTNDASRLPQPPICGGVTIENKIYGGSDTSLREFPWMVLLEYERRAPKNGNRIALSCGGSLINQRYVVTAAHCVRGTIEKKIGPLIAVRLGEHDTSRKVDCDSFGSCTPQITRVGFEELITHELYKDSSNNKQYDIALIRLDRNIRFSDAVSPVCLPSAVRARSLGGFSSKPGTQVTVAGWGQTLESAESPVKQKLQVPLVDQRDCQRKFRDARVNIVDTQLCAGGKFAEDSCGGDSGGPLMHFRGGVWVLEGIISFGYRCGLLGWPGVYTRVSSFEDWILSKLRT